MERKPIFHCLLDSFVYMNCRNEAKVSPTQSKDYAVPYVSRLRNETFLTSNTNLDVYAKLLWEKEKKFVPLIFILLRNN
jgi:hypothetical protein